MPFQHHEGTTRVLENLFECSDRFERGDPSHEEFNVWLCVNGGALCGTVGAGLLAALHRFRVKNGFSGALTSSTGTPATIGFGSGTILDTRSVYSKECTSQRFLSKKRLLVWLANVGNNPHAMNIDYLCDDVLCGRTERDIHLVDRKALDEWRAAFHVATTTEDGKDLLIDVSTLRTVEEVLGATKASIALPGISRGHVRIGDRLCFDGDGACTFPPAHVLERFNPPERPVTDILVFANGPRPPEDKNGRVIPGSPTPSKYLESAPPGVRETFLKKHLKYAEGLDALRAQTSCRYLIFWVEDLAPFCQDPNILEAASLDAEQYLCSLLEQCRQPAYA